MKTFVMQRIVIVLLFIMTSVCARSQKPDGNWAGTLQVNNNSIPIVIYIAQNNEGKRVAAFDSPKEKLFKIPFTAVDIKNDSIVLSLNSANIKYAATINKTNDQLTGIWGNRAGKYTLHFNKITNNELQKLLAQYQKNRSQTPKPPFPYNSEDVEYDNVDKSIHFGATFTYPKGQQTYPTVILITGSGQTDRDNTVLDHKPFAVIADFLTKNGIAVLRVDDRGMGKTTGPVMTATTADFAKDVEASLNYLLTRKEVDKKNMGLIGHSEGGIIAPMVASKRKEIKFIIMLAGPGVKMLDQMAQQSVDVLKSYGASAQDAESIRLLYKILGNAILQQNEPALIKKKAIEAFKKWQSKIPEATFKNIMGGAVTESKIEEVINPILHELSIPWNNYFMKIDPSVYLTKLSCAVLALNGNKDIQVSASLNLPAIQIALEKSKSKEYKVQEIPELNHLFQHCKKCTVEEYGELEETFAPEVLEMMSSWIQKITKK